MNDFIKDIVYCSITDEIFFDPVTAEDGFNYERWAIEYWLVNNRISPMTGLLMGTNIVPNITIKQIVNKYLELNKDERIDQFIVPLCVIDIVKRGMCDRISLMDVFHINVLRSSNLTNFLNLCNASQIKEFIAKCIPNEKTIDNKTVGHIFCSEGKVDEMKQLVNRGIYYHLKDSFGRTLFHIACKHGNKKMITYLINICDDLDSVDNSGRRPIDEIRDDIIIKMLKDRGITLTLS